MAITINKISVSNNILSGSTANLVVTRDMTRNFGSPEDFVESHISNPAGNILYSIVPFQNYKIPGTFQPTSSYSVQELEFYPDQDLANIGISYGDYVITYNVLRPKIVKDYNPSIFIKEISGDRTEVRLSSNNVDINTLINNTTEFINEFQSLPYFKEFYLNFGKNQLIPCVNIALDLNDNSILVKLLNPLPLKYKVNDLLLVVDEISNPQVFEAEITIDPTPVVFPTLRGANFDLDLDSLRAGPTPYYNFNQITTFNGTFAPQLQQLLSQLSASNFAINIDYTNYEDFVHFSSAARRLEGFKYKLTNIEALTEASASASLSTSPTAQLDSISYQNKINGIIQSFDGWEQYLYFESSSYTWPKQNADRPYILYSVTSSEGISWYSGNYDSASLYDDNNQNYILYTIPGYIVENTDNELAFKFVASVGQMFDDIWIHIKAITDLYQAKNSLTQGISKDLVYFALQSMGINTYTDQDGNNVFQYLYGINEDGTYLPSIGPYDTLISASNYQLSGQDQQKGIYKRMYHNLPLLLKSKGTNRFIQYLNTVFGIPTTVMGYIEYGGVDKLTSSFEYEYDRFNYGLNLDTAGSTVEIPWIYLDQSANRTTFNDIVADGIELRFKAYTTSSTELLANFATQSLFYNGANFSLNLLYTDTGSNNTIYANTIARYGYLEFDLGGNKVYTTTVPVFETGSDGQTSWYSVLVQRRTPNTRIGQVGSSQTYDIYIKNSIFGEVGHVASASLTTTANSGWSTSGTTLSIGNGTFPFSGSVQELRLWSYKLNEDTFDSHVLNPESIEGNTVSSSFEDLAVRFTLGNNLYTYNHSLITTVDSTHPDQNTQILTATFNNFPNENNYSSFTETYYADVANSGYANPVVDKVRIYSGSAYGTQLLPHKSIEITPNIPITKDIHLLDAGLSPQDEIDRAIVAALGSTYNLDDIIGDPNYNGYLQLKSLQHEFFKKFIAKYNYKDYIRLIEFFHNSLFRTLKDFTPARTNPATGIIIKPHLLERSVVARPEVNFTNPNNESVTIDTAFISGSNGGDYSQSLYDITYTTPQGLVTVRSDARDFFNGVFPSSSIDVHRYLSDGTFNPYLLYNPVNNFYNRYSSSYWNINYNPLLNNVSESRRSNIRFYLDRYNGINYGGLVFQPYTCTAIGGYDASFSVYGGTISFLDCDFNPVTINVAPGSSDFVYRQLLLETLVITGDNIYPSVVFPSPAYSINIPLYVLNTAEIQDFTYDYARHARPRYIGSKTTSTQYNFFTSDDVSFNNQGIGPYGRNSVIDKNTTQFSYFEQAVCTGSQYLAARDRTNLYLKYLIDEDKNLTELVSRDYINVDNKQLWNLYQVQNLFKKGDTVNISLFDSQTPSYQRPLNGNKTVFDGGYKYPAVLWKTWTKANSDTGSYYYVPNGIDSTTLGVLNINNFAISSQTATYIASGNYTTFKIKVDFNQPFGVPYNVSVKLLITYKYFQFGQYYQSSGTTNASAINRQKTVTATIPANQNSTFFISNEPGKNTITDVQILSVYSQAGAATDTIYKIKDLNPELTVDQNDKKIISCSFVLSQYYNNGLYYSGSVVPGPVFPPPPGFLDNTVKLQNYWVDFEYEFNMKPGDLVRFDYISGSINTDNEITTFFLPSYEYTILDVNNTGSIITFTLDKEVEDIVTMSNSPYLIDRFIFMRRIPDESNVVLTYRKNDGPTSGGIVKNKNLSQRVEDKLANIVSDLKSKIFSTVLTT